MKKLLSFLLLFTVAILGAAENLLVDSKGDSVIVPKKEATAEPGKEGLELTIPAESFCAGTLELKKTWKKLSLSMEMKATGLVAGAKPWQKGQFGVSFKDQEGKTIGKPRFFPAEGTTDWIRIEQNFDIPAAAVRVLFDAVNFGKAGTLEIRRLTLSAQ